MIGFVYGRFWESWCFSYKKRDNKQYMHEQRNILEQRYTYLKTIHKLRNDKRTIIYTDETWVNTHHCKEQISVNVDGKGGWKVPSGKGQRLIVVHAGEVEGWVPGTDLVFRSKTNSADYHDEMNSEHFIKLFRQKLLLNIPPTSVIVLENTSYHNKQKDKPRPPTTANRKNDIKRWLDKHNKNIITRTLKKHY